VSDREPHSVRIDPDVYSEFVEWVEDKEGQKRHYIGQHVENALREYIDTDRNARIEQKVDQVLAHVSEQPTTHTHKQKGSETVEKVRAIYKRLTENHGQVIPTPDVHRAIEDIAGADDRTIAKYERMLKRRSLLFEHPGQSAVWTPVQENWVKWCESKANNEPSVSVTDLIQDYGVEIDEYDSIAERVEA